MKFDDAVTLCSVVMFALGILCAFTMQRPQKSGFQPKSKTPKEEIIKHPPKGGSAQQRK